MTVRRDPPGPEAGQERDGRASNDLPLSFIAWTPIQGRSAEIALALGGEARCIYYPSLTDRRLVPLRYLISAYPTARYLFKNKPRAVIATNPPLLPGLIAWAYGALSGATVVLDSHPGGFGAQNDLVSEKLQFAHRWLARRVAACMVTDEHWVQLLESWGARAVVVHEAPPLWSVGPPAIPGTRPVVLFVGTFGGDEPVEVVFEAARLCPQFDVRVTGDERRCAPDLLEDLPSNVTLTGFLGPSEYRSEVEACDAILTLSTEPTSVMRAAYEAVYAKRPLILSDWPGLRRLFPYATPVENTPDSIARGLRLTFAQHDQLRASTEQARVDQESRWTGQLDALRACLQRTDELAEQPPGRFRIVLAAIRSITRNTKNGDQGRVPDASLTSPTKVAGVPVSITSWNALEEWGDALLTSHGSATICTVAPFQVYLAKTDPMYRACLERASVVLIDGNGVRLVLLVAGVSPGPRLTGRELVARIHSGELFAGTRVAVIGGAPSALRWLEESRQSWCLFGGHFSEEPDETSIAEIAKRLEEKDVQVVLVALGSPKMERWADALSVLHPAIYASVGGAIDTLSGVKVQPPEIVTRVGVEFAWRAAQDRSLVPRIARGLSIMPSLIGRALSERRTSEHR